MQNLLTLDYWFNLRPETFIPLAQKWFMGLIIALVIVAIITLVTKKKAGIYRGFLNRFYAFCSVNAIIGLILVFFNYENVPFFSARFWIGFWAIIMVIWLLSIFKSLRKIPLKKKQLKQEEELKKYIP
jgi:hypothetical protein